MEEKNRSMTDEALSQQLRRHKSGKLTGRLLSLVGVVIAVAGIVLGGNIVAICGRWSGLTIVATMLPPKAGRI